MCRALSGTLESVAVLCNSLALLSTAASLVITHSRPAVSTLVGMLSSGRVLAACTCCQRALRSHLATAGVAARAMGSAAASDVPVIFTGWANKTAYIEGLRSLGVPVVDAEDLLPEQHQHVKFAAVWNPQPGFLQQFPHLQLAMSLGAGVDSLLGPGKVPDGVAIARIIDPVMAQRMATWVLWGIINWQRKMEHYLAAQRSAHWDQAIEAGTNRDNPDVAVGVMGLGVMGLATCRALAGLGYRVSGWSRTAAGHEQHAAAGISCYAGQEALQRFVAAQDVLVCLLPLTPQTQGVVNAQLLSWLPRGAALINGGRGKHVVEADLLAALDKGQVSFALLDVFDPEPLPPASRLWSHPAVRITPHVASITNVQTAVEQLAANYHSVVGGRGPLPVNLVAPGRGY